MEEIIVSGITYSLNEDGKTACVESCEYIDIEEAVVVKSLRVGAKEYPVTRISDYAFYECYLLRSVEIPMGVTDIGNYAFYGCSSLRSIAIPASVTDIGEYAFWGCCGLRSIVVDKRNVVYDSRGNCNAIVETDTNMLVLSCKASRIPESVSSVYEDAISSVCSQHSTTLRNCTNRIGKFELFSHMSVCTTEISGNVDVLARCFISIGIANKI